MSDSARSEHSSDGAGGQDSPPDGTRDPSLDGKENDTSGGVMPAWAAAEWPSQGAGPPEFNRPGEFEQDQFGDPESEAAGVEPTPAAPPLSGCGRRRVERRLVEPAAAAPPRVTAENLTPQQRLLLLDTWQRSGLPAGDFAALVGVSKHTLYAWKKQLRRRRARRAWWTSRAAGRTGSRLPELTKRTILHAQAGQPRLGLPADQRHAACAARPCRPVPRPWPACCTRPATSWRRCRPGRTRTSVRRFERARPNQLWQTDLFTFMLKRQNRRVYLVAFMDDHSRFIVGYGLHASQSAALVLEVLRAAIASLRHARGDPDRQRHAVRDLARQERVHQGAGEAGHPADRGRAAAAADAGQDRALLGHAVAGVRRDGGVRRPGRRPAADRPVHRPLQLPAAASGDRRPGAGRSLLRRGAGGAADAAGAGGGQRPGAGAARACRSEPFYLTGQVGGQPFSVHAEGERVILTGPAGTRQEVDLARGAGAERSCPSRSVRRAIVAAELRDGRGAGAGDVAAG